MSTRIRFTLLACLLAANSCTFHGPLTDNDKVTLIRRTLEIAIVEKQMPDFRLLKDTTTIILSSKNIDPGWVPTFDGVHFVILTPDSILARTKEAGDFLFLEFREMRIRDDGRVEVSLNNLWAVSRESRKAGRFFLSGGGIGLTFKKSWGRWKEEGNRHMWMG